MSKESVPLNKKPSLQVQAQETANLPVLPNESVGLSYTPLAAETSTEEAEKSGQAVGFGVYLALSPSQSIEPDSVQRAESLMRSDSTGTNPIEGQVAPLSRAELKMKIAKAEKALETINFLIFFPGIFAWAFHSGFSGAAKEPNFRLDKEANLPYKLAW